MTKLIKKDPTRSGVRPSYTIVVKLIGVAESISGIYKLVKLGSGFNKRQTKSWFHFWFTPAMAVSLTLACIWLFFYGMKLIR